MKEEKIVNRDIQPLIPAWKIWKNPIVRRYARSRLRPTSIIVWMLVYFMLAGFFYFLFRQSTMGRSGGDAIDAARVAVIPVIFIQCVILFIFGAGQAAGGMTGEADEGVVDYQRLAPMSPLAKAVGYLFGLTIREWVCFLSLFPFVFYSFWKGEIPFNVGFQLYSVIILAGILYHLTGVLAGTVMKNRRWAFLGSMGLVFMLYTVLPQIAKFGLVYFKYLTIWPVVEEFTSYFAPREIGNIVEMAQKLIPTARFFGLDLPQSIFTLLSQGVLVLTMLVMLCRRWRRQDSHLMGKVGAVGLFGWIQLVLLGNSLPLIESGSLFPSQEFRRRFGQFSGDRFRDWQPGSEDMLFMLSAFGIVTMLMLWLMSFLIIPNHEGLVRGWRRARKQGQSQLSALSDPSTATPWVIAMAGIGTIGWTIFARELISSRWFPEYVLSPTTPLYLGLVLFAGGLILQGLLEWKGRKVAGLSLLLGGILPVMIGIVSAANSDDLIVPSVWLIGIFPGSWPVYASQMIVPSDAVPLDVARSIPLAFQFWVGVALLLALWITKELWAWRKTIAQKCE